MQTIHIDLAQKTVLQPIYAKQGDVGRKFRLVLTESGLKFSIPESALLSVWYMGSAGEGNYTHIGDHPAFSVYENTVDVEMIAQMLLAPGAGMLAVSLAADDRQIGLWNIPYMCEKQPGFNSEPAKEYYTAFSKTVENLLAMSEAIVDAKNFCLPKAGFIYPLAMGDVPDGFLLCDGAEHSRTEYAELFEAIGTIYGEGDGETTFNVPNLSTRVPVGAGYGFDLGATGGEKTHTLTEDEIPAHYHAQNAMAEATDRGWDWTEMTTETHGIIHHVASTSAGDATDDFREPGETLKVARVSAFINTSYAGGGEPHNNMQPYTVINYIISTGRSDLMNHIASGAFVKSVNGVAPDERGEVLLNKIDTLTIYTAGGSFPDIDGMYWGDDSASSYEDFDYSKVVEAILAETDVRYIYYDNDDSPSIFRLTSYMKDTQECYFSCSAGSYGDNYSRVIGMNSDGIFYDKTYELVTKDALEDINDTLAETVKSVNDVTPDENGSVTVPIGLTKTLLWENASPNSSFAAQTVAIENIGDYDEFEVLFKYHINTYVVGFCKAPKMPPLPATAALWTPDGKSLAARQFVYVEDDEGIQFLAPYFNALANMNAYAIPYKIYGIKGVE